MMKEFGAEWSQMAEENRKPYYKLAELGMCIC